jgi:hypothetical protein
MIEILRKHLQADQIETGTVIRDVTGRLSYFLFGSIDEELFLKLEHDLRSGLGTYGRPDRILASGDDYGSEVLTDETAYYVLIDGLTVRIVDRRLVGMDWLRPPANSAMPPPRFVFASLKGGVGRSTALSVAALHLANNGKRVLVVDLDMEAPGLSAILLSEQTLPKFGMIDALVENGISGLDDQFMQDLVGSSALAGQAGRIDVLPAFGRASIDNPADVLGKLARAYAEDITPDGSTHSILDQVRELVDKLADPARYDAILVDARAGLHETSASAILGLGADILFFGMNEEQTFQGYAALFAHLSRLKTDTNFNWIDQVTMVQAKASGAREDQDLFAERCINLFRSTGIIATIASTDVPLPATPFSNVPWNDELTDADVGLEEDNDPRLPLIILDDERFKHYAPRPGSELMLPRIYQSTFGPLLDRIDETLAAASQNGEP